MASQLDDIENFISEIEAMLNSPGANLTCPGNTYANLKHESKPFKPQANSQARPSVNLDCKINCLRPKANDKQDLGFVSPRKSLSLALKSKGPASENDKSSAVNVSRRNTSRASDTKENLAASKPQLIQIRPRVVSSSAMKQRNTQSKEQVNRLSSEPKKKLSSKTLSPNPRNLKAKVVSRDDSLGKVSVSSKASGVPTEFPFSRMLLSPSIVARDTYRPSFERKQLSSSTPRCELAQALHECREPLGQMADATSQQAAENQPTKGLSNEKARSFLQKVRSERMFQQKTSSTQREGGREMSSRDYEQALKALHTRLHEDWA